MTAVRTCLYLLAAFAAATGLGSTSAQAQTKLKMILDWKYQGQMAIYFLAADRGYFKDEGLEIASTKAKARALRRQRSRAARMTSVSAASTP